MGDRTGDRMRDRTGDGTGDGMRRRTVERQTYWKTVVALFFFGWVLLYANRTVLSPLLKVLGDQWHLNNTQLGLLNSVFFLMYALMQIPSGVLADRLGRRRILLPGFFLQGAGALASGLAPAAQSFLGIRAATGLGQGTYYSAQYALAAEAIPREHRGLGTAIINSGMAGGIILGLWLSGTMVYDWSLSWRWPVLLLGAITLAAGALMAAVVRERPPVQGNDVKGVAAVAASAAVARSASVGAAAASPRAAAPGYVRTLVLTSATALCSMYGFYVILTWLPYYLQTARGMAGGLAANISTLMPLASVPGGLLAARLSDRLGRRRPVIVLLAPFAVLSLMGIVLLPGVWSLGLMLLLYGFCGKLVIDPLLVSLVADVAPPGGYGTAFGILNFASTVSMVAAPTITGFIVDHTGSFVSAFYLAAGILVVGWAAMLAVRERGR